MHQIRTYFEQSIKLSDQDWEYFASKLQKVKFDRKQIVLPVGSVENHLSFIESGILRLYIPKPENDLTFGFAFENGFASAYDSFLTRQPSTYQIEALSSTTLWRISHADLQQIYAHTAVGNIIGRYASEDLFLKKSKRELSLLNETAEERYLNLFSQRPELLHEIPLKYIASYIGITPQALSRIRKRIS